MTHSKKETDSENGQKSAGDSQEQREAEQELFHRLERKLNVQLERNKELGVDRGATVNVDAFCKKPKIFCEIFAHLGKLKGGQVKKVMTDAMKLLYVSRCHGGGKRILVFANKAAALPFRKRGKWMAECLRANKIQVLPLRLSMARQRKVEAAQIRQGKAISGKGMVYLP